MFRAEPGLVLALLVAFAFADGALRLVAPALSGSIAHTHDIPALVDDAADDGKLLFIGNSLTNNGVDARALAKAAPRLPEATKIVPDGSSLWEWYCIVDNQLIERSRMPSTVIIGFAWHQLSDQSRLRPSPLGAFFCQWDDLPALRTGGLNNIDQLTRFGLAKASALFALRETLRNRTLSLIIPHYQHFAQQENPGPENAEARPAARTRHSYETLTDMIQRLRRGGTDVVLLAMPIRGDYDLDPALRDLTRRMNVPMLDYRNLPGIDPAHFKDSMHLDPRGARRLTGQLAEDLPGVLDRQGGDD